MPATLPHTEPHYPGFIAGIGLSVAVGTGGGLIAVLFRRLIEILTVFFFTTGPEVFSFLGPFAIVPIPAVGGLLVGLITHFWLREIRGHGIPEVMYSLTKTGGRLNPKVILGKPLAAAICIGSGGSVGRFGPIVHTSAAVGSGLGQLFRLPTPWIRILAAAGTAAGISSTFNAPLTGVFFSFELLTISYASYGLPFIVVASVSGKIVSTLFYGNSPVFDLPETLGVVHIAEIGIFFLLGVGTALIGYLFIRIFHLFEDLFEGMTAIPEWLRPVVGGLIVGFIGLYSYDLLGVGDGNTPWEGTMSVQNALRGEISIAPLFILIGLKILATSSSIGSGGSGGVFAPIIYLGSLTGLLFAYVALPFFPGTHVAAYVLVGAAALFGGVARAPLTAIILIVELTQTYSIIIPVIVAVFTSSEVLKLLSRETIYTEKLKRKGVDILRLTSSKLATGVSVGDIMTEDPQTVSANHTIGIVRELFLKSSLRGFPVLDGKGELYGIITPSDVASSAIPDSEKVRSVCTTELITAFPDETLTEVIPRIFDYQLGQVPIVDPRNPKQLLGILRDRNLLKAWKLAYEKGEKSLLSDSHLREKWRK